jgi:energy-coupling factor transporter ATP-binding protein EcfA2
MIRRLYAHNFRSLENFEMTFTPGQPTVLMGANGSGKSSVRLALERIQANFRGRDQGVRFATFGGSLTLEADFVIDETTYKYEVSYENDDPGVVNKQGFLIDFVSQEKFSINGETVFHRAGQYIESTAGRIELGEDYINESCLRFEPTTLVVKLFLAESNILTPVPSKITTFDVPRTSYSDARWLFAKSSDLLGESARSAVTILTSLKSMITGIEDFNPSRNQVEFRGPNEPVIVPASELSDGEKMLFLAAYLISAAKTGKSNFLLWDEPECFLAKSEIQSVTKKLVDAYKDGQLILCTHDAEVANVFDPEHVLWFYRDRGTGPTRYKKLSELPPGGPLSTRLALGDLDPE